MQNAGITHFRRIQLNDKTWLPERLKHIQATDCAKILNCSPWGGPQNVYDEKTGAAPQKDISGKPYVIYGKKMEPLIRQQVMLDLPYFDLFYDEFGILENIER